MPDSSVHRHITECALHLAPLEGGNEGLVGEYCTYPDAYFSDPEKLAPYMFFLDGVQFHYLPDTPYAPLYRYWDAAGCVHRTVPFVNENFRHAKAGFTYYLEQILRCFRLGQPEEGKKYLGCLLHMLEDSTFGVHALEGPGGTDLFALDRMLGLFMQAEPDTKWASRPRTILELAAVRACHPEKEADPWTCAWAIYLL